MGKLDHFFKEQGTALIFSTEEYMQQIKDFEDMNAEFNIRVPSDKIRDFALKKLSIKGPAFDDGFITWDGRMDGVAVKVMDMNTIIDDEFFPKLAGYLVKPFSENEVIFVVNEMHNRTAFDEIKINGIRVRVIMIPEEVCDEIRDGMDYDGASKLYDLTFGQPDMRGNEVFRDQLAEFLKRLEKQKTNGEPVDISDLDLIPEEKLRFYSIKYKKDH